ncbi:probable helicase senataxin isoform X2 [Ischnura elegans]|uniref:probable helicase senataxin isoform X2 n=1 Tax=Ischnura elegans TaxID=197161 RepID=UPI001ED8793A|nr:probable helicase senataxin isoform X2 [Ischnura elegans]
MKWLLVREDSGLKVYLSAETEVYGIGRARECFIKCQSLYSSRHHCDVVFRDNEVSVIDLSSSNGTFVNGIRIAARIPTKLKENDVIGIGVPRRLDVKSILYKVAIELDDAPSNSSLLDGNRKRNSSSEEGPLPAKISRLHTNDTINSSCASNNLDISKERPKNDSIDLISVSLNEQTVVPTITTSLIENGEGESSALRLEDCGTSKKCKAEVIDLVESDDEGPACVPQGIPAPEDPSPVQVSEVSSIKDSDKESSLITNRGYTDENDVIVISDDEDDLFSSSLPMNEKSNTTEESDASNQEMGEQEEKELVQVKWECDSDESDNEWWPKLSQSFSESFDEYQTKESEDVRETSPCDAVAAGGDEGDENRPLSTDDTSSWFPVLSQDFDNSDDGMNVKEENVRENENLSDEEERSNFDLIDRPHERLQMDHESDENASSTSEDHGNNLIIAEDSDSVSTSSVHKCAEVLEKVTISPENVLSEHRSNEKSNISLGDQVLDASFERNKKEKRSSLTMVRLSLESKKGPMVVEAPVLKGRTCIWGNEGTREKSLDPREPSSTTASTHSPDANVDLKKCNVILEDIMYGKKRERSKFGRKEKQKSPKDSRGKNSSGASLTKADKMRIKAERKLKLQQLSDKTPKEVSPTATNSRESEASHSGKVAAKVTEKNRGAFLTEFDLFGANNSAAPKKGKSTKKGADDPKSKKSAKVAGENDPVAQASTDDAERDDQEKLSESDLIAIRNNDSFQSFHRKEKGNDSPKCGILKPANQNTEKKKKKVTFTDKHECKMYVVEPGSKMLPIKGKDYPLMVPPGGGMNFSLLQYPSITTVVYDICRWNAHWLEEQRSKPDSEPPPVHLDQHIMPLARVYNSFLEYYKSFYPILLYEMWSRIYKEWDQSFQRNPVIQVLLLSQNDAGPSPTEQEFVFVHGQSVISDQEFQNAGCPKVGDLVIWEFPEENVDVGGPEIPPGHPVPIVSVRVFAYVDAIKRSNIASGRVPVSQMFSHVPQKSSSLISITLKFKKRKYKMCLGQMGRLKVVCHLLLELRSFDALLELPKSPLVNHLLNPLKQNLKTLVPGHFRLKSTELLNPSQRRAVAMAKMVSLASEPRICLIQGPPGTGKTKVIITLIMEMFGFDGKTLSQQRKDNQTPKILLCAPSNAAIDNVVLKLLHLRTSLPKENRFRLVRVGRLESMNPHVRDISLQELTSKEIKNSTNNSNDSEALELHISTLQAKLNSILMALETVRARNDINGIKNIELKLAEYQHKLDEAYHAKANNSNNSWAKKDTRNLELMAERNVLQCADIIATTLASSVNSSMLDAFPRRKGMKSHFSCCIIDEACQSLEVDCLIPLKLGISNLVLVGDQQQLYPTVMSMVAKNNGLEMSLFERLWSALSLGRIPEDTSPTVVLNVQYRMHPEICHWPNMHVYQGILKTPDDLVMERQSPFLPFVILSLEFDQNDPNQLLNDSEADLVSKLFFAMSEKTEKRRYSIGVITPYQRQKDAIEGAIMKRKAAIGIPAESLCEVNTIDSFQGQERDVVIMSCVRSYKIGFLGEMRRINVALTRARRSLVVCGNFSSLKNHELWNAFLSDGVARGVVRCVSGCRIPNQRELLNLVSRGANE